MCNCGKSTEAWANANWTAPERAWFEAAMDRTDAAVTRGAAKRIGGTSDGRVVRWLGIEWLGCPKPVRWWWRIRYRMATVKLPACGCCRRAREAWEWVAGWFRRSHDERAGVRPSPIQTQTAFQVR